MKNPNALTNRFHTPELISVTPGARHFRALDSVTGELVALRVPRQEAWMTTEEFTSSRRRFLARAQSLTGFSHPRVVAPTLAAEWDGFAFSSRPFVYGKSLATVCQPGWSLPGSEISSIARDLSEGLDALNKEGLSHGRVTPENIFIGEYGRASLTDAGFALASASMNLAGAECTWQAKRVKTDLQQMATTLFTACCGFEPEIAQGKLVGAWDLPAHAREAFETALGDGKHGFQTAGEFARALTPPARPVLFDGVWRPAAATGLVIALATITPAAMSARKESITAAEQQLAKLRSRHPVVTEHMVEAVTTIDRSTLELTARREGIAALAHPIVAEVFQLTDGQREGVAVLLAEQRSKITKWVEQAGAGEKVDVNSNMASVRRDISCRIERLLTVRQRQLWAEIALAPVELFEPVL
jgi:hypothetical protein